MSNRRLLAAVAVLWSSAYVAHSQTLGGLLAAAEVCTAHECPRPPPPSVCGVGALEIRMQTNAPGAVTTLHLEFGERLAGRVIEWCAMVTAWNERDALLSETVARDYPPEGCLPVPEPSVATGLALGCLALAGAARRR